MPDTQVKDKIATLEMLKKVDDHNLEKDFSELDSVPSGESIGNDDLVAIKHGDETYKVTRQELAEIMNTTVSSPASVNDNPASYEPGVYRLNNSAFSTSYWPIPGLYGILHIMKTSDDLYKVAHIICSRGSGKSREFYGYMSMTSDTVFYWTEAVGSAGGSIEGNLVILGDGITYVRRSATADVKNNPASDLYTGLVYAQDKNAKTFAQVDSACYASGRNAIRLLTYGYDTSGNSTVIGGIYIYASRDGKISYGISNASAFRSAIDLENRNVAGSTGITLSSTEGSISQYSAIKTGGSVYISFVFTTSVAKSAGEYYTVDAAFANSALSPAMRTYCGGSNQPAVSRVGIAPDTTTHAYIYIALSNAMNSGGAFWVSVTYPY